MNNRVVGVITWGVNAELGQNLNFAVPCTVVTELLVTARQQGKPLDSIAGKTDGLTEGIIWTSLTSGHDYSIRRDGDYLYMDLLSIPAQERAAGAFQRAELKKTSDGKWQGEGRSRFPCTYTKGLGQYAHTVTNWCSREDPIEVDFLSDTRIEGIAVWSQKYDCGKCEPKGAEHKTFTLIPNNCQVTLLNWEDVKKLKDSQR